MKLKNLAMMALLTLAGCQEHTAASPPQAQVPPKTYKYLITQYHGANDLAVRSKSFLTDEWHFQGDGWISLVNPRTGRQVWLSGTVEIEEGRFKESSR
jgi:hypothetical protein